MSRANTETQHVVVAAAVAVTVAVAAAADAGLVGCWLFVVGCWLLAVGCLAVGCWVVLLDCFDCLVACFVVVRVVVSLSVATLDDPAIKGHLSGLRAKNYSLKMVRSCSIVAVPAYLPLHGGSLLHLCFVAALLTAPLRENQLSVRRIDGVEGQCSA